MNKGIEQIKFKSSYAVNRFLLGFVFIIVSLYFVLTVFAVPVDGQTTCSDLGSTFGSANYSLSNVQSGNHRLWIRMKSTDGTATIRYNLSGGGALCNQTVAVTSASSWRWVQSTSNLTTSGGNVAVQLSGTKAGVGVDCIVLTSDTTFNPTTSTDCAGPQIDTTPPILNFTAPAQNATISAIASATATATDTESTITQVAFSISGNPSLNFIDTTSPYEYSINTALLSNGPAVISAVATNSAGLTTSRTRNVTVNNITNPLPDTTAPIVSVTAPANGSSSVQGNLPVSIQATDNVGIASVEIFIDGVTRSTLTSPPYNYSLNTSSMTVGNHSMSATARDIAGNQSQTSAVSFTLTSSLKAGDIDGDGIVNLRDFSILASNFGRTGRTRAQGDLTGDGVVGLVDFSILASNFGK